MCGWVFFVLNENTKWYLITTATTARKVPSLFSVLSNKPDWHTGTRTTTLYWKGKRRFKFPVVFRVSFFVPRRSDFSLIYNDATFINCRKNRFVCFCKLWFCEKNDPSPAPRERLFLFLFSFGIESSRKGIDGNRFLWSQSSQYYLIILNSLDSIDCHLISRPNSVSKIELLFSI